MQIGSKTRAMAVSWQRQEAEGATSAVAVPADKTISSCWVVQNQQKYEVQV